ncbi:fatty acyl-AMP ligase [Taklimakanibacter lacteus]|uniref:fatty acyl-AMP ligase n=1 Tax=Taklimakanibacter lacteus TaxID=2268456 RepID=UPI000E665B20
MLAKVLGGFATLTAGLDYAARGVTGFNFYSSRGQLEHVLPYRELRTRAIATARKLLTTGLKRGERVAIVAETSPDFMAVFFGCQYAGLVPCPMPYSMYIGGKDAYVSRIAGMLKTARARAVILSSDLASHIGEAARIAETTIVKTFGELQAQPESIEKLRPFDVDDVAYIQYSSGSTSSPKGVLITQKAIVANTRGILRDGLKITNDDRAFSWLPLYHDMGLVGFCLSPMMGQVTVDYLSTTSFARRPALWLKLMSENRNTIAYSPSFGFDLAARRINGEAATLDLTAWRVAGIGGDMVRADVLNLFSEKMSVARFDSKAFTPSYGMAESTLAITFADLSKPVKIDVVDRLHYKLAQKAVPASEELRQSPEKVRSFVVCGRPIAGHEIVVRDDNGKDLGERDIGHILFKGPSLMAGYFENVEATQAIMTADGYMDTGDMGYWLDGEIVITGRAKDLILHNGRNIWPQDIEWAAERIEPLRSGDAAAFAVEGPDGDDDVVVLIQCRVMEGAEMEELRRKVAAVVHQTAGVECEVVLVAPKSLPFTSSGKLSRAGAKDGYLTGEIAEISPVARVPHRPSGEARLHAAE